MAEPAPSAATLPPPQPDGPPRPATLAADPNVPRLSSQIVSVWRRSQAAEGNPFHTCFSRVPLVASEAPAKAAAASPSADDVRPPPETCPEDDLVRLASGQTAIRLLADGLSGSADWHRDRQVSERLTLRQPTDRSVLIQTKEHLAELTARFPALAESLNKPTSFGENLLLSGDLTAKTLCIGDVLHIVRPGHGAAPEEIVGVLQVSNPRLPCFKVDHKHKTSQPGQPAAGPTVRGTCAATGLAGFFCRVLQPGSLAAGDRLVLAQRHRPQWTLAGLSDLLYGGRNAKQAEIREWRGTEAQLKELLEERVRVHFTRTVIRIAKTAC